jgi:hypothetical protein
MVNSTVAAQVVARLAQTSSRRVDPSRRRARSARAQQRAPQDDRDRLPAAFVGGIAAKRLHLPVLVGYLLAGVAIGPFTPGLVADSAIALELARSASSC